VLNQDGRGGTPIAVSLARCRRRRRRRPSIITWPSPRRRSCMERDRTTAAVKCTSDPAVKNHSGKTTTAVMMPRGKPIPAV